MASWRRIVTAGLGALTLVVVPVALAASGDFRISTGNLTRHSSAGDTAFGRQIGLDAAAGTVHAAWADTSLTLPGNPDAPNADIAAARIDSATQSVSPNINLNEAPASQIEPSIAVDPSNPRFVAAAWAQSLCLGFTSLFVARSADGGATWVRQNIIDGAGEPELGFDSFGNLFVAFMERKNGLETPFPVARLWLSADHGASFSALDGFPAPAGSQRIDLGVGGGAVWTVVRSHTNGDLTAFGAPVSGLGSVGAFVTVSLSGPTRATEPDIAVGPDGAVFVSAQHPDDGPPTIDVRRDPDGFGPAPFEGPVEVTTYHAFQNDPLPRIAVDASA